jgi:hypothetical protein
MNARACDLPFDETVSEIDWNDIIATTQDDVDAGRYAFTTEDYPTDEEGMAALWDWMCSLGNGGPNETSDSASHATRA